MGLQQGIRGIQFTTGETAVILTFLVGRGGGGGGGTIGACFGDLVSSVLCLQLLGIE